jgi:hypothetical protein
MKERFSRGLRGGAVAGAVAVMAFAVVVVLVAGAVQRASVEAISIEYGRWTGDVTMDSEAVGVHFDVYRLGGRPRIRLLGSPAHGLRVVEIVSVTATADGLAFAWPGPVRRLDRQCTLSRQPDGVFTGDCVRPGQPGYAVRMVPPSAGHQPSGLARRLLAGTAAWRTARHGPIHVHVHRTRDSTVDADALGRDAAEQLTESLALLGETSFAGPLHVFAVQDPEVVRELAGRSTAALTDPLAGAIVMRSDAAGAHELRRGIVVDDIVRFLRQAGRLPAFAEVLAAERTGARVHDSLVLALQAASLIDLIRHERGIGAVRRIWQRGVHAALAELDAGTPQLLEAAWLARLAAQPSTLDDEGWMTLSAHGCG